MMRNQTLTKEMIFKYSNFFLISTLNSAFYCQPQSSCQTNWVFDLLVLFRGRTWVFFGLGLDNIQIRSGYNSNFLFIQAPGRLVRLLSTSELLAPRTLTPSPSPEERAARSRRPEAEDSPEDTRSKLYLCIFVVVSRFLSS